MKNIKTLNLFGFLLFFMLLTFSTSAQSPPETGWSQRPGDENSTGDLEGGDPAPASLGNSTSILILMAAGATLYAFYGYKNKQRLNASKE
jgi:hypothetical protein